MKTKFCMCVLYLTKAQLFGGTTAPYDPLACRQYKVPLPHSTGESYPLYKSAKHPCLPHRLSQLGNKVGLTLVAF